MTSSLSLILLVKSGMWPSASDDPLKDKTRLFGSNLAASNMSTSSSRWHAFEYSETYAFKKLTNSAAARRTCFEFMSKFCHIRQAHQCGSISASPHDRCFGICWQIHQIIEWNLIEIVWSDISRLCVKNVKIFFSRCRVTFFSIFYASNSKFFFSSNTYLTISNSIVYFFNMNFNGI